MYCVQSVDQAFAKAYTYIIKSLAYLDLWLKKSMHFTENY